MTTALTDELSWAWDGTRAHVGNDVLGRLRRYLVTELPGPIGVLCTPSQVAAGHLETLLGALPAPAVVFDACRAHAPIEVCRRADAAIGEVATLLALGGGAAIGVAKALAVQHRIPLVAVPTTYSGSELTPLYGITEDGVKLVRRDLHAQPVAIYYNLPFFDSLPAPQRISSLGNSIAHALACADSPKPGSGPTLTLLGSIAYARAALAAIQAGNLAEARMPSVAAAIAGGVALRSAALGRHHALCHAVGGITDASHSLIHSIVLPFSWERGWLVDPARVTPQLCGQVHQLLAEHAAAMQAHGMPTSLRSLGIGDDGLRTALNRTTPPLTPAEVESLVDQLLAEERLAP